MVSKEEFEVAKNKQWNQISVLRKLWTWKEGADWAYEWLREDVAIKLGAISTASLQNTPETIKGRITKENPYWSVAYSDVCVVVDREVELRDKLTIAVEKIKELEADRHELEEANCRLNEKLLCAIHNIENAIAEGDCGEVSDFNLRQCLAKIKGQLDE